MEFIDAASNTINHTVQGIKRDDVTGVKHTRLACMICRRRVFSQYKKYQTTHIAWNAEQFMVVLHVCVFLCLKYSLRWLKFCCTSAKNYTS